MSYGILLTRLGFKKPPSNALQPKVYRALLTQTGTSAPVATVLENTFGAPIVWSRTNIGYYYATLDGAFVFGKTFYPPCSNVAENENSRIYNYVSNTSQVRVDTLFLSAPSDGMLINTTVEIIVYP